MYLQMVKVEASRDILHQTFGLQVYIMYIHTGKLTHDGHSLAHYLEIVFFSWGGGRRGWAGGHYIHTYNLITSLYWADSHLLSVKNTQQNKGSLLFNFSSNH